MSELQDWWNQQPLISRHVGLMAAIIFGIGVLEPSYVWTWLPWSYGYAWKLQLWRLVTSQVIPFGKFDTMALVAILFLFQSLSSLEAQMRRSDLAFFLIFSTIVFGAIGPYLGYPVYLSSLSSAVAWTLSMRNPNQMTRVLYVFNMRQKYTPWINLTIAYIDSGKFGFLLGFLGVATAHLFFYFREVVPALNGPNIFKTPEIVEKYSEDHVNTSGAARASDAAKRRFEGRGNRLGS